MTRILALDSSTDACSVALLEQGRTLERFELAARSHTQQLLPMIDSLLAEAGCGLADVDALAFARGPGSFTGIRIGLGIIQGLAFARDLPVIGVSTLDVIAAGFYRTRDEFASAVEPTPLLVALDARMQEIYWALLQFEPETGLIRSISDEAVTSPEVAAETMQQHLGRPFWGIGPGWHYPALRELKAVNVEQEVYPHASDVAHLALAAYARGEAQSAELAQPVYLRDTVTWKKRQRIRS